MGWDGFSAALRFHGATIARIVTAQRRDIPRILHCLLSIFRTSIGFVLKVIERTKRHMLVADTSFKKR